MEKENVWSTEEKKSEEGKGGKYLVLGGEKDRRQKRNKNFWRRKIFIDGKHLVRGGDEAWRRKRRKSFGEREIMVTLTDDNRVNIVQSAFSKVKK